MTFQPLDRGARRATAKFVLKRIYARYVAAGRPLLPLTRLLRGPLRWYFHRSPLLRHDSRPALRPYLLSLLHRALVVDHPHDFRIYGDRIAFRSFGSLMSVQGYYVGEIEYHLVQYVVRQIRPDFVMLDVGAHHGLFTLVVAYELRARGWPGVIHSFEPDPQNFALLKHNVEQNGLSAYVVLHNAAVADVAGAQELIISLAENSGNTLVASGAPAPSDGETIVRLVPAEALDDLRATLGHVDLIKLDIQGGEPLALAGAAQLIARDRPLLVVEAAEEWPTTARIRAFLLEHGYTIHGVDARGQLCAPNSADAFVSWDWVGTPTSRF